MHAAQAIQWNLPVLVPVCPSEAEWTAKGAEAYRQGDYSTAVRYYKRAAARGDSVALSNLGYCYYYGRSVAQDMDLFILLNAHLHFIMRRSKNYFQFLQCPPVFSENRQPSGPAQGYGSMMPGVLCAGPVKGVSQSQSSSSVFTAI